MKQIIFVLLSVFTFLFLSACSNNTSNGEEPKTTEVIMNLPNRTIYGMDVERIASNLFARSVGKYAEKSLNRVNATWGQGWLMNNRSNNSILIQAKDPFATKYLKIWYAAENIRNEALKDGIFLAF